MGSTPKSHKKNILHKVKPLLTGSKYIMTELPPPHVYPFCLPLLTFLEQFVTVVYDGCSVIKGNDVTSYKDYLNFT